MPKDCQAFLEGYRRPGDWQRAVRSYAPFPSTALGRRAARRATRWSQPRTRVARSCGVPSRRASPCAPRYCQPRRAPAGGLTITIDRGQFLPDLAPPFYGLKFPVSGVGARSRAWFCRSCGPSVGPRKLIARGIRALTQYQREGRPYPLCRSASMLNGRQRADQRRERVAEEIYELRGSSRRDGDRHRDVPSLSRTASDS